MSALTTNKAIKYRIYPTAEQKVMFAKTFGCCRKIWNLMLSDKIEYYQNNGTMLHITPAAYKDQYPFLKDVDSLALANVQLNLQNAYKAFFSKKAKFPKYKSAKHSRKSYTTNNQGGTVSVCSNGIRLPKIGTIKAKIHRTAPDEWVVKSATVSQEPDGTYYVSVLYVYEITKPVPAAVSSAIGLDYKSDGLYMDSEGNCADMPHYFRNSQKKLARAQRRLSRKTGNKKGSVKSKNYLKQQNRVNKIYRHSANQRKDYLHKISTGIANRYDAVCVEDLNMRSMSNKGFRNGKATLDNGYGMFRDMLEYKLTDRGKYFIKIDKWYPSSQLCPMCGSLHPEMKDLSRRIFTCECGYTADRDMNAAKNILQEGLRILSA